MYAVRRMHPTPNLYARETGFYMTLPPSSNTPEEQPEAQGGENILGATPQRLDAHTVVFHFPVIIEVVRPAAEEPAGQDGENLQALSSWLENM